jgi:hypothetical protein
MLKESIHVLTIQNLQEIFLDINDGITWSVLMGNSKDTTYQKVKNVIPVME